MDLLRKEMERKKRALAQAKMGAALPAAASGSKSSDAAALAEPGRASTKYLNAGQLRRRQEEEEERLKHAMTSSSKRPRTNPQQEPAQREDSQSTLPSTMTNKLAGVDASAPVSASPETIKKSKNRDGEATANTAAAAEATRPSPKVPNLDSAAITSELRSLGLAVRLFGEAGDEMRLDRLQRAAAQQQSTLKSLSEKQEFRLGAGHAIRNPFLDQDKRSTAATTTGAASSDSNRAGSKAGKAKKEGTKDEDDDDDGGENDGVDENDPHKRIYSYLKSLLQQWEHDLSLRPESVRSSVAGRRDTNTLQQCKDYIAPLFKLLKRRQLEASLTANLTKIVAFCQEGEFVRANDAYMDIAIGRAAWPIGVTQVGIHSRTGRSKIESSNVAHVMNSELQRKYLTSVKRLITYAQAKSSADPSKKVLN